MLTSTMNCVLLRAILVRPQYIPTIILLVWTALYVPYAYINVNKSREDYRTKLMNSSNKFQSISTSSLSVFSAYYDSLEDPIQPMVKVFGFQQVTDIRPVYCKIYINYHKIFCFDQPVPDLRLTNGSKVLISERETVYKCPVELGLRPLAITLTQDSECNSEENLLPIIYPGPLGKIKTQQSPSLGVCLVDVSSSRSNLINLIESIIMHRLFGADGVMLYVEKFDAAAAKVLWSYVREDFLTVVPWSPGDRPVTNGASILATNDCLYRSRDKFDYIIATKLNDYVLSHNGISVNNIISLFDRNDVGVLAFATQKMNEPDVKSFELNCNQTITQGSAEWNVSSRSFGITNALSTDVIFQPRRTQHVIQENGIIRAVYSHRYRRGQVGVGDAFYIKSITNYQARHSWMKSHFPSLFKRMFDELCFLGAFTAS